MAKPTFTAQLEEIVDGVFLHGRETSDKSHGLPEGQYTVADGLSQIEQAVRELIEQGKPVDIHDDEIHGSFNSYDECHFEAIAEYRQNLLNLLTSTDDPAKDS